MNVDKLISALQNAEPDDEVVVNTGRGRYGISSIALSEGKCIIRATEGMEDEEDKVADPPAASSDAPPATPASGLMSQQPGQTVL